jgi:hypothetical protein
MSIESTEHGSPLHQGLEPARLLNLLDREFISIPFSTRYDAIMLSQKEDILDLQSSYILL